MLKSHIFYVFIGAEIIVAAVSGAADISEAEGIATSADHVYRVADASQVDSAASSILDRLC